MLPVLLKIAYIGGCPRNMIREYLASTRPYQSFQSGEEAVQQIRAILGMGDMITNANLPNSGQISNLPLDAVVETTAFFSRNSVRPLSAVRLPPGVHAQVSRHVANQEMMIEAALRRDKEMAFQAVFNGPNTQLPIDQAWAMFNKIGLPAGLW